MPSLLSHYWVGINAKNSLPMEAMRSTIDKYAQEFAIGTQGPDLLLYAYSAPWQSSAMNKHTSEVGNWIHDESTNAFFASCLKTIRETEDEKLQMAMVSYVAGFLCHWALDSTAHPFVCYRTGLGVKGTENWHCRYESMLDNFVADKLKEEKVDCFPPKTILNHTELTENAIHKLLFNVYRDVYGYEYSSGLTKQALKDFRTMAGLLCDKTGIIFGIMRFVENLTGNKWKYTRHCITFKKDETIDICNENHQFWTHPCDASEVHHESFWDLCEIAKDKAYQAIELFSAALGDEDEEARFMEFLNDCDYCTGRNTKETMKYSNSIY